MLLACGVPLDSTIKELEGLVQFLTDYLKFSAEYYDIARENTGNKFSSKLEDVVRECAGANELLIIYYAKLNAKSQSHTISLFPTKQALQALS